jgi:hypothetical protein
VSVATPTRRPTPVGTAVAVLAAVAAVGVVADRPDQLGALAVEALGVAAVVVAVHRDDPWSRALAAAGWLLVAAALALGATLAGRVSFRLELVPGMVGVAVAAAGLAAPRGWPRRLLAAGVTVVALTVLVSGVIYAAGLLQLLAAAALALVAWDAGDHAIGLGAQIGRDGVTPRVEAAHLGWSVAIGVVAVVAGVGAAALPLSNVPLAAVLLLVFAVLALAVALWL